METAYEVILSLPEDELAKVWCDLSNHCVYHKQKCIFDGQCFVNFHIADDLNELQLIKPLKGDWIKHLADLYQYFVTTYPKRCIRSNLLHPSTTEADYLFAPDDFHASRLAIELFIIFHSTLADLLWEEPSHFAIKPCSRFVIKREWIKR